MKHGEFPTQERCDPKKPDEFMAWAMVAPPHLRGAALILPSEYCQLYSKHMWDVGFRWYPKYQKKWWQAPASGDPHWLTSPGRWVDHKPGPKTEPDMVDVLEAMKKVDEDGFFNALEYLKTKDKK